MENYQYIADLIKQIPEIPSESIISRTFYRDDRLKVLIFGFAKDQELSEHTASMPAIIHILKGEAKITAGMDVNDAHEGSWLVMPPNLSHSVYANTPLIMLLYLLRE